MAVPLIKYPLDLTGAAPSNLITGETHDLSNLSQKAFVLNYGPFYTRNLVVRNLANGAILTPKTQYVATQLFVDMTLRTGLDICSVIVITDKTLPSNLQVSVDAQMVGGEYSSSVDALQQLVDALDLGDQPVKWADILGRPVQFPPAPHLHDLGDVYGFEYLVAVLERIVQAIYVGDEAQLAAIYQYIDHEIASVQEATAINSANLTAHLADYTNPHRVTKAQVGLGSVDNFATATNAQAVSGVATTLFMTPANTAAVTAPITATLNTHIGNVSNPHQVTKAQVGLGNVANYTIASTAQAQAGTDNATYMTPALTASAISTQALVPLNAHIANTSNPHAVTKAQVGLGSVDNFATASSAQGVTGTSTVLFMTPAATAAAIQGQVGNTLAAHIANVSNPHQVTKAQVGLGSVQNYGVASTAQAQAGTDTATYMTPALTASAISTQALAPLNAHIANVSNPHQVTAAQVGAYTVAQTNSAIASTAAGLQTQINGKQNNLGYTPVQQSGGSQQLSNKIYIGHSAAGPRLQVDTTDFGPFSFKGHTHPESEITNLVSDLAARPTTSAVAAMIAAASSGDISYGSDYLLVGNILVQWGIVQPIGVNQIVNFSHSYGVKPTLVSTPQGTGTGSPSSYCWDTAGVNTGGFQVYHNGFGPSAAHWIAIGVTNLTAFNTPGAYSTGSGGGGAGGGGSCVTQTSLMYDGVTADQYVVGRDLLVTDAYALTDNSTIGKVLLSEPDLQPCVRITTADGTVLECSTTAPIPTKDNGYVLSQDLQGQLVPTAAAADINGTDTVFEWSEVVDVEYIGMQWVQKLFVENRCFWASKDGIRFILHHNLKANP